MNNTRKWIWVLSLGAAVGIAQAYLDRNSQFGDYIRHAIIELLPTVAGLKTTLEKAAGIQPEQSKSAAAGD